MFPHYLSFRGSLGAMRLLILYHFICSCVAKTFNISASTNLAVYWGQNSFGATDATNTSNWQQPIGYYCNNSDSIDILPIAFVPDFNSTGGLPSLNLANTCSTGGNGTFPGTSLPNCTFLASQIQSCQDAGKIVTISLGGQTGITTLNSDEEGAELAQNIWDLFLGGNSTSRPFGTVLLDGVDMDIESGTQTGFISFLTALRQLMDSGTKQYYITAAPQCPYPDLYIGNTLNNFTFDAVFVQFYNNYCGLHSYNNTDDWNFAAWDNWAKTNSPNPNVKVYLGAPASSSAASSGYVDPSTITTIIQETMKNFSSFGGVMLWDASQAFANSRYDDVVKAALTGGTGSTNSSTTTASNPGSTVSYNLTTSATGLTVTGTTAATPTPEPLEPMSCSGFEEWQQGVAYEDCDGVIYDGLLWAATEWNYDEVPDGASGAWEKVGSCVGGTSTNSATGQSSSPTLASAPVPTGNPSYSTSATGPLGTGSVTSMGGSTPGGSSVPLESGVPTGSETVQGSSSAQSPLTSAPVTASGNPSNTASMTSASGAPTVPMSTGAGSVASMGSPTSVGTSVPVDSAVPSETNGQTSPSGGSTTGSVIPSVGSPTVGTTLPTDSPNTSQMTQSSSAVAIPTSTSGQGTVGNPSSPTGSGSTVSSLGSGSPTSLNPSTPLESADPSATSTLPSVSMMPASPPASPTPTSDGNPSSMGSGSSNSTPPDGTSPTMPVTSNGMLTPSGSIPTTAESASPTPTLVSPSLGSASGSSSSRVPDSTGNLDPTSSAGTQGPSAGSQIPIDTATPSNVSTPIPTGTGTATSANPTSEPSISPDCYVEAYFASE